MYKLIKILFFTGLFIGLLITNVLTLTSTAFNALLSGALATYGGVQTVSQKIFARQAVKKSAVRTLGKRMIARTGRIAVTAVSSLPLKALPVLGVTAVIAGTIWELQQLCAGLNDISLLYAEMDIEEDTPDDTYQQVCHPSLPDFLSSEESPQP